MAQERSNGAALSPRAHWSIREEVLETFDALRGGLISREEAIELVGSKPEAAVETRTAGSDAGAVAVIPVMGIIMPRRGGLLSLLFGGVGLESFREQFRDALSDGDVAKILLVFDSPGGIVDLVPETAAEIRAARGTKPIEAVLHTEACSAAYWIAAQADRIASTPSGSAGGIGVFVRHVEDSRWAEEYGLTRTIIKAGKHKAEANTAEPLSDTAREHIQQGVDALHQSFIAAVAAGRGVKEEDVRAGYGEGRVLLAEEALEEGMVDSIETLEEVLARMLTASPSGGGGALSMRLENAPPAPSSAPTSSEEDAPPAQALTDEDKRLIAEVCFE